MVLDETCIPVDWEVRIGISKCLLEIRRSVSENVVRTAEDIQSAKAVRDTSTQVDTIERDTRFEQMPSMHSGKCVAYFVVVFMVPAVARVWTTELYQTRDENAWSRPVRGAQLNPPSGKLKTQVIDPLCT